MSPTWWGDSPHSRYTLFHLDCWRQTPPDQDTHTILQQNWVSHSHTHKINTAPSRTDYWFIRDTKFHAFLCFCDLWSGLNVLPSVDNWSGSCWVGESASGCSSSHCWALERSGPAEAPVLPGGLEDGHSAGSAAGWDTPGCRGILSTPLLSCPHLRNQKKLLHKNAGC